MNKKTRKKPPEGGPFRSITMSDEIIPHSASGRGVFLVGPLRGPGSKGSEGRGCGYAAGCVKRLCSLRSGGDSRLQRLRVAVSPDGDEFYSRLLAATLPEAAKTIQPRLTVSRLKGRPFYVQAMGQLRLTCTFSAECAQRAEMHPFCLRHLSTGKRLTRFSGRYAPLQITFACHPGGGGFSGAMPRDAYEAKS